MAAEPLTGRRGPDPAFEDLTARARIRDAALRLFAERGTDGTTVRDIAKAAGVSAGLVRHHFGSKEGLREACDAYVLDRAVRVKERAVLEGQLENPAFIHALYPTMLPLMRYLARAMVDGSRAAATMFDDTVEVTEQWLARHHPGLSTDPRAYAAVLVAMNLGRLVLHEHVSRVLGVDVLGLPGQLRMSRATVEIHAHPLVSADLAMQLYAVVDQLQDEHAATATTTATTAVAEPRRPERQPTERQEAGPAPANRRAPASGRSRRRHVQPTPGA